MNDSRPNGEGREDETKSKPARGAYVAPRIEDDLELEVMSLACTGLRPKTSAVGVCKTLGS